MSRKPPTTRIAPHEGGGSRPSTASGRKAMRCTISVDPAILERVNCLHSDGTLNGRKFGRVVDEALAER